MLYYMDPHRIHTFVKIMPATETNTYLNKVITIGHLRLTHIQPSQWPKGNTGQWYNDQETGFYWETSGFETSTLLRNNFVTS